MVSVAIGLLDRTADFLALPVAVIATQTTPTPTPPGHQTSWALVAVNSDGTGRHPLQYATPITIRWPKKNVPMEVDFTMPIDDPTFAEIDPRRSGNREIQVYRNGHILCWGKATTRRADSKSRLWTITMKDPTWYFTKRHIGKANRTNYLLNGDFESGLAHWNHSGAVTVTTPTDDAYVGTHYARMVGTGTNGKLFQWVTIHSGAIGLALFFTVWRKVAAFVSPAGFNLGASLTRLNGAGPGNQQSASIIASNNRQIYERIHLVVNMPPNVTETIECAMWVGVGENHFDAATLTVEESIDFATYGPYDQATILSQIVQYAQGHGPWGGLSAEKSNLHVQTSMAATGVKKRRVYQLADHQKVYDGGAGFGVCDEFLQADDGVDWRCEFTPTTKTIKTYYPRLAPVRLDLPLVWVRDTADPARNSSRGIVDWNYGDSLEPTANQVVILGGWGSTADAFASREEGGYNNPSTLGGLTLEIVDSAPQTAPVGMLQSIANGKGHQLQNPVTTPTFVVAEPRDPITDAVTSQYIGVLLPGTIVPLDVEDGTVILKGEIAISSVTLDCKSELLSITVDA